MKMRLCVTVEGHYKHYSACKDLPDYQQQCFDPLKTCSDPTLSRATKEFLADSDQVRIVVKTREDAAENIARELAEMIVLAMKKNDTHNGYPC